MNRKHAYLIKSTEEEKYFYNYSTEIWGGELPNVDSRILIYKGGYFNIDEWSWDNDGFYLIENDDYKDFYWCELEEPNTGLSEVNYLRKPEVLELIEQLDEPKKPVIPKYVAEWIKSQKESFLDVSAIDMYDNLTLDNNGGHYHEVWVWVIHHHYDFIKAWHDGYEVEK